MPVETPAAGAVLVTGANGFLGATLVRQLLADGNEVVAAVGRSTARLEPLLGDPRLRVVPVDLRQEAAVRAVVADARPRAAYHLAWSIEPGAYMTAIEPNLASVRFGLTLVEALLAAGCPRLVVTGTCAEYALGPAVLAEDAPTTPGSVFGAAKVGLATAALAAAAQAGATLAWARVFYVLGPGEDAHRAVPQMVQAARAGRAPALHKPGQRRDHLHVDDVATGLRRLAGSHGPVNVCSGRGASLGEVWDAVRRHVGVDAPDLPAGDDGSGEPPIVGDPTRLESLGWRPELDLDAAVADTVAWWLTGAGRRPPDA